MSQRAWEPCVNADKEGRCYYHISPYINRQNKIECDSRGKCDPQRADYCEKYDVENYGSVVMI